MKTKTGGEVKRSNRRKPVKKDLADSYNQYKFFEGQQYTSMKIDRSHNWYYDQGEWRDHKNHFGPREIEYQGHQTGDREGSGVWVGTEYHWYILAHQHVRKLGQ